MNVWIGDTESNGLLDEATVVWCGAFKNTATLTTKTFEPHQVQDMLTFLTTVDMMVMHNCIGHDLPLLEKLYGYQHKGKVLDTLVMSRLLQPERVGRHSIGAWGERFGRQKPKHEDWSQYSTAMLYRCTEDVEINYLVYSELLREAELNEEDLVGLPCY